MNIYEYASYEAAVILTNIDTVILKNLNQRPVDG